MIRLSINTLDDAAALTKFTDPSYFVSPISSIRTKISNLVFSRDEPLTPKGFVGLFNLKELLWITYTFKTDPDMNRKLVIAFTILCSPAKIDPKVQNALRAALSIAEEGQFKGEYEKIRVAVVPPFHNVDRHEGACKNLARWAMASGNPLYLMLSNTTYLSTNLPVGEINECASLLEGYLLGENHNIETIVKKIRKPSWQK